MTWNHRVVYRQLKNGEHHYAIHEVFYNDNREPYMITEDPIAIMGENVGELKETLERMTRALKSPVLRYEDF